MVFDNSHDEKWDEKEKEGKKCVFPNSHMKSFHLASHVFKKKDKNVLIGKKGTSGIRSLTLHAHSFHHNHYTIFRTGNFSNVKI